MLSTVPAIELIARFALVFGAWLIGVWVFSWVSLILHEFGHYAAGALARLHTREIRLGSGRIWRIFNWGRARLILHRHPVSGWVVPHRRGTRLQEAVMILGGPVATAALAYVFWQLASTPVDVTRSRAFTELISFCRLCAMMETAGLLVTLWPARYQIYGQSARNDGLLLWTLFFPEAAPHWQDGYVDVNRALAAGEKEEAARLARELAECCESGHFDDYQQLLASTLIATGQIEAAAEVYREQLNSMKSTHPKFQEWADNFASMALYANAPNLFEESERWIRAALDASPRAVTLKGTLAGLLVEKGAGDEALPYLRELHALADNDTDLGISAAYLSVLAERRGAATEAARYREEARKSLPEHPLVLRLIGANAVKG